MIIDYPLLHCFHLNVKTQNKTQARVAGGKVSCCRDQGQKIVLQDTYGGDVAGSGNVHVARHRSPTVSLVVVFPLWVLRPRPVGGT